MFKVDGVQPRVVQESEANRDFMNAVTDRAMTARQDVEQGIERALSSGENAFTPYDVRMSGALTNRYRQALGNRMQQIRAQQATTGFQAGAQALGFAGDMERKRLEMATRNMERIQQAQLAREQARSAVIGSLLGSVGQIGGSAIGMMAGGPAGAQAGAQAGSSFGRTSTPQSSPYEYREGMSGANTRFQTDPSLR